MVLPVSGGYTFVVRGMFWALELFICALLPSRFQTGVEQVEASVSETGKKKSERATRECCPRWKPTKEGARVLLT